MVQVFRLSSSLRVASLAETLAHAQALASQLGISRVTDITRLDCVGVPVFASVRPNAQSGSLCVNAGKGLAVAEAQVGAYMEAIEFAYAEYNRARLAVHYAAARNVYEGLTRADSILDFCPVIGTEIDLDARLPCVEAQDISTREKFLVPAELVFLPCPDELCGTSYFGSGSNGLCSGNSLLEATVHGVAEAIERDIISFFSVDDQSSLVETNSLPPQIKQIETTLARVNLELRVRFIPNIFEMPFFAAYVAEPKSVSPFYINGGFGCHPSKQIAITRAVCEAFQSRLSFIHGGRDDLIARYQHLANWPEQSRVAYAERLQLKIKRDALTINYSEIPDHIEKTTDLASTLEILLTCLRRNNFARVLRVAYTPPQSPLQVARIIVPRLENFNETTNRIGLRLRNYVRDKL